MPIRFLIALSLSLMASSLIFAEENQMNSRKISVTENGKRITVVQNDQGITVTTVENVNGKEKRTEVKAANAQELMKKNPSAGRLFERLTAKNGNGPDLGLGNFPNLGLGNKNIQINIDGDVNGEAGKMLREQLEKMIAENSNNPALQELLRETLKKLNEKN